MDQFVHRRSANSLAFFESEPHVCSYLPNELSTSLFADPSIQMTNQIYQRLINFGFRRSGSFVYTPNCSHCNACQSVRLAADQFEPNRSQRRTIRLNSDLELRHRRATYDQEHFELYRRYINERHAGSSMENPSPAEYMNFLTSTWSDTYFYEFRRGKKLLAVSVVDKLSNGLSAVYSFYDPDELRRGLGKYVILSLIDDARRQQLTWIFLGYWIDGCQKMQYKIEYQPAEIFYNGRWQSFSRP